MANETKDLYQAIVKLREVGVFVDPLLSEAMHCRIPEPLRTLVDDLAKGLIERYIRHPQVTAELGELVFSESIMRRCIHHSVISTACAIVYDRAGTIVPKEPALRQADRNLVAFLVQEGAAGLYRAYLTVVGYDLLQSQIAQKRVPEEDFLSGMAHSPYPPEDLELFLMMGLAQKIFRFKIVGGIRCVQLTRHGREVFQVVRRMLLDTGYQDLRVAMSHGYLFDHFYDYDHLCKHVWPDGVEIRRQFVDWVGITSHAHVLEVASGSGILTYDGGLLQTVGPAGRVTATDISHEMVEQARRKRPLYDFNDRLELLQASVENLPFASDAFNAAIGSQFLQFTDIKEALQQMFRVVEPGGLVALFQSVQFDITVPFFEEWFAPIIRLRAGSSPKGLTLNVPTQEEILAAFRGLGACKLEYRLTYGNWIFDDPERAVQHLIRGSHFFIHELLTLSWGDRIALIRELVDRGSDICRHYSVRERILRVPSLMVKAEKPLFVRS